MVLVQSLMGLVKLLAGTEVFSRGPKDLLLSTLLLASFSSLLAVRFHFFGKQASL